MKKIKIILVILFIFIFSGCYREESIMTINKDKSIDFEIKVLVEDDFNDSIYVNNSEGYELRKIKIQSINEYGHKGYKLTKHYDNIDEISSEKDIRVEITKYVDPDFDDSILFKVKKGYLRNTYTASFLVDKEYIANNLKTEKKESISDFLNVVRDIYSKIISEYEKAKEKETLEYTNENITINGHEGITFKLEFDEQGNVIFFEVSDLAYNYRNEKENILLDDIKESEVTELEIDPDSIVTFILNLPRKSISNNANKLSRDGKSLTWSYNEQSEINKIEFSFYLYNRENIYKLLGLLIIIFGGIPLVFWGFKKFINRKKEEFEDENPIYTDCDESIKEVALKGRRKIKTIDINKKKKNKTKKNILRIVDFDK